MSVLDMLCVLAAALILVTAVARLNDIKRTQTSKRWWVRRIGLLFVTTAMMMFIASYFTVATKYWWLILKLLTLWGFCLTWMTTPGMPPWWKYVARNDYKLGEDEDGHQ